MSESELISKGPCPDCGSSDACATYSDRHSHCYSCGKYRNGADPTPEHTRSRTMAKKDLLPIGEFAALPARRISEETCKKWGYTKGTFNDRPVQIATYRDDKGQPVAQKLRFPDKTFTVRGDLKAAGLYGQWLWRDKGKKVVVVEGEIDALTVSQLQGNKWPVVSVPNGAQGASKAIAKALEWLTGFDEVIFMFDMDAPGMAAAVECAELLPPGKAKIASLPLKDANECLVKGQGDKVIDAIWGAKAFRPDGIVSGSDLWEMVRVEDSIFSQALPWTALQAMTRGIRAGELWMFTSGSGMGKSAVVREIAHHLLLRGQTVGMLMLEETIKRTALGMMGISANHPLHIDREGVSEDDLKKAFDETLGTGRLFLYDHFGSTAIDNLTARIRYLAKGCGCKFIVLDHLSIVVSGNEEGDERRMIDNTMTALKTLAMECDVALIVVSHLKRPGGDKGHEEGATTSLSQLRGSHAIAQLSDFVVGLERDQQGENPMITTIRILKNRFTGETGIAGYLAYERSTGRLSECDEPKSCDNSSTNGAGGNEDF